MNPPSVSVLVPVYNGERYLSECLDSILKQKYPDLEILIADDGSTDNSLEIIKAYATRDARIQWWKHPQNLGPAGSFNLCLQKARGDYIKFVCQDDILVSAEAVRMMAEVLESNPDVTLVASAAYIIDAQSRPVTERNRLGKSQGIDGRRAIIRCLEQNANLIGEPSIAMFRRPQSSRGFDARFRQTMDLEMWFYLLEQGRLYWIAQPLGAFRQHPAQQTETIRGTSNTDREGLVLLDIYYQKEWLRTSATQKMLYSQLRSLRRTRDRKAEQLKSEMQRLLRPGSRLRFWAERKLLRPFKKLADQIIHLFRRRNLMTRF